MDPHAVETWAQILGDLPAPAGVNTELLMADRILGDLVGYLHPTNGINENTRRRRMRDKERDRQELANAMTAYARMMFDAGVRP